MTVIMVIMALAVVKLNNVTKTQLVNRTGQTFETGKVIRILEDNIQEDGMRVGQQTVVVKMTSGVKKGQELTTTSSAGYLFGAACKVGMRVVVLQSVAGNSVITSVYSMDRKEVMIGFVVLYLLALCLVGGLQGVKGALGLIFTFGAILFIYLPVVYMGYSPFWTAVFICAITTAVTMYLIGGASEKTVCAFRSGTLDFPPIIRRLIDHSAICVRIPERIAGISNTVCKNPVTAPAASPASSAIRIARIGFMPLFAIIAAQTHPPSAKLPSTVRSAISNIL